MAEGLMQERHRLTDAELAAAKHNLAQSRASLACEGIFLTAEEEALFQRFEDERLSHEERRHKIIEFCRAKQRVKAAAAVSWPTILFREGNGRTLRAFLQVLAEQAAHRIDMMRIDPQAWNKASREADYLRDSAHMRAGIAAALA